MVLLLILPGGCGKSPSDMEEGGDVYRTALFPESPVKGDSEEERPSIAERERNHRPEILSVTLSPRLAYPGTRVKAEVEVEDRDGDPVILEYRWRRNDKLLTEVTDELDTTGFKKGDFITVTVTPYDGKERGNARRSPPLILTNRPPRITSIPPAELIDGKYIYRVEAIDEDGDDLTFTLEKGPEGMVLDPSHGILRWDRPEKGVFHVRLVVSDGDGAAFQEFTLKIK